VLLPLKVYDEHLFWISLHSAQVVTVRTRSAAVRRARLFDEYDVVHIVVRVRMSVITTTDARISLSLARSLARRRSCYYYDP